MHFGGNARICCWGLLAMLPVVIACDASTNVAGGAGGAVTAEILDDYRPESADGEPLRLVERNHSGAPARYVDGSPVHAADGTLIDYRPRNVQRELARLPRRYVRDIGQRRLGGEGDSQLIYLEVTPGSIVDLPGDHGMVAPDPDSSELCWQAMTCNNPSCAGDTHGTRLEFVPIMPGFEWPAKDDAIVRAFRLVRCPQCGSRSHIDRLRMPEVESRRETLEDELARLRAKWRR
ncbi:MAG: hypothetical protein MI757_08350 [Pirellulales bacterium]|nr:hypothetical protein [Pirellulales bacterium]